MQPLGGGVEPGFQDQPPDQIGQPGQAAERGEVRGLQPRRAVEQRRRRIEQPGQGEPRRAEPRLALLQPQLAALGLAAEREAERHLGQAAGQIGLDPRGGEGGLDPGLQPQRFQYPTRRLDPPGFGGDDESRVRQAAAGLHHRLQGAFRAGAEHRQPRQRKSGLQRERLGQAALGRQPPGRPGQHQVQAGAGQGGSQREVRGGAEHRIGLRDAGGQPLGRRLQRDFRPADGAADPRLGMGAGPADPGREQGGEAR
ncbi:hypothetical protein [Siccirubricoccus sp. G192]|uniref:hypothetical protein n=1 Tax=Siccirubricoccus sp. G192 TaxID=2849651 RepID=UPI001C2CAD2F|nr:hypothetical protein [Siccirubricoccus sp. G192]MBV1798648.1 hypothetical protein [Siccirubricoccus sp. G192]